MGKVIEMIDLLNMVFKKEIKDKQKFRVTLGNEMTRDIYYVESKGCNICCFKHCSDNFWWSDEYNLNDKVEILDEEQEEIDIQNLKETNIEKDFSGMEYYTYSNKNNTVIGHSVNYSASDIETRKKINELVQAVKQLDNKLKEK